MKYINVLLLSLFAMPHISGMQPDNSPKTTPCNLFRTLEIQPHERLEIAVPAEKFSIMSQQTDTGIIAQIYSAIISTVGSNYKQQPAGIIYLLALTEITKRMEQPYTIVRTGNIVRIEELAELNKLGITLKELIITLPSNIPKETVSIISNQKLKDLVAVQEK